MSSEDDEILVRETKRAIEAHGANSLAVTDVTVDDLPHLWWSGNAAHVRGLAVTLERVSTGEIEYLAVRAPNGLPVAKGGIDYTRHDGAGLLWQLSTHWLLQSLGIGTRLITAAEERIKRRGLPRAVMGVEVENTRAQALYERLGYQPFGHEQESWESQREDGTPYTHVAECILLEKTLEAD